MKYTAQCLADGLLPVDECRRIEMAGLAGFGDLGVKVFARLRDPPLSELLSGRVPALIERFQVVTVFIVIMCPKRFEAVPDLVRRSASLDCCVGRRGVGGGLPVLCIQLNIACILNNCMLYWWGHREYYACETNQSNDKYSTTLARLSEKLY